MLTDLMQK